MNSEWKRGTTEIKQNEGGRIREAEGRDYSSRMQLPEVRGGERLPGEDFEKSPRKTAWRTFSRL